MQIGELARLTGCAVDTIRYYEKQALLPPPARSAGNFRDYADSHVERLRLIRHCRALDMSLDEIRSLLAVHDQPQADCSAVNALLDAHLGHVRARLRELQALEGALVSLRQRCASAGAAAQCGILHELTHTLETPTASGGDGCGHVHGAHG